ncbi:hypothetical protein ACWDKQ_29455 [Saccharopolyspora sp. NPDC000995]
MGAVVFDGELDAAGDLVTGEAGRQEARKSAMSMPAGTPAAAMTLPTCLPTWTYP